MNFSLPGMNRTLFCSLLLFSIVSLADAQFEGVIVMKVAMRGRDSLETGWYRLSVKRNLLRTELTGAEGVPTDSQGIFIYRGDSHTLSMLNRADHSCTDIRLGDHDQPHAAHAGSSGTSLVATGKKDPVLGYPCDGFLVDEPGRKSTILATDKFGAVYGGLARAFSTGGGGVEEADWSEELATRGYFPMKIVTMSGDVTEQVQEVTSVAPGAVPDSLFEPPSGYTRIPVDLDLGKILQGIGGGKTDDSGGRDSSDHR
jgi:hypothetical protein